MSTKRQTADLKSRIRAPEQDAFGRGHVTEIQRARMIAAMIDVVFERGRANTTVAHVVARSGVSRRTFYEVFDDFEDCFLAALDQSLAEVSRYVSDVYDPAQKWRTRIRSALAGVLEFLDDEPAMGRLCVVETLGAGLRIHERRLAVLDVVVAAVDDGRKQSSSAKALPPLTSEGVVGGVLSVLHARLIPHAGSGRAAGTGRTKGTRRAKGSGPADARPDSLLELTGALMAMIVLPYIGPAAAAKEAVRPTPRRRPPRRGTGGDPLRDLEMRLTYRTVRVLLAIADNPDGSNRQVGAAAGIDDQGQISKLLARLEKLGLVYNNAAGQVRGAPNAWLLTKKGVEVERLVAGQTPLGAGA
ncbi:MAG TPA: TetR family transcriptional regulator [Solirubrobacteraceae bacterium]|jgi:AcrR family transcriptional regulator